MSYWNPAYNAAKLDQLNFGWQPTRGLSPDQEVKGEYATIVARTHDQTRNNAIAKAIITAIQDYVCPTGLTPIGAADGPLSVWHDFAKDCGVTGTKSWDDIYRDIVIAQAETGGVLLYTPLVPTANGQRTRVDLIEATRISTPDNYRKEGKSTKGNIRSGVVFDKFGREIGYYVSKIDQKTGRYMTGTSEKYQYIEKTKNGRFNAVLLRRPDKMRPGETRQQPLFVSILQQLKDNDDLWDAVIQRAQTLALNAVLVSTNDPEQARSAFGQVDEDETAYAKTFIDIFGESKTLGRIAPGTMTTLPLGAEATVLSPSGSMEYDALFLRNIRILGAAIGFPLEILLKDFSKTSFSSGKLAYDGVWRLCDRWNGGNSVQIANPLFRHVIMEAWLNNDPRLSEYNIKTLEEMLMVKTWIGGPKVSSSDPGKESIGEQRRMDNSLTTEEMISATAGVNWNDIAESKKRIYSKYYGLAKELAAETDMNFADAFKLMLRSSSAELMPEEQPEEEEQQPGDNKND